MIIVDDVTDFCPPAGSLSSAALQRYVDMANLTEACLVGKGADESIIEFLQLSLVCHLITKQFGGQVKSQSDFEGASVTFETYQTKGYGLESTTFGQNILSSAYYDCFKSYNKKPSTFIKSIGRNCA